MSNQADGFTGDDMGPPYTIARSMVGTWVVKDGNSYVVWRGGSILSAKAEEEAYDVAEDLYWANKE